MVSRDIPEGELIPRWWGIAYRDFDRNAKVAYPIPLNFLVRWERDLRCWLMNVGRPGYRERIERRTYLRGRESAERASANYTAHVLAERDAAWEKGFFAGVAQGAKMERERGLTREEARSLVSIADGEPPTHAAAEPCLTCDAIAKLRQIAGAANG